MEEPAASSIFSSVLTTARSQMMTVPQSAVMDECPASFKMPVLFEGRTRELADLLADETLRDSLCYFQPIFLSGSL